MLIRIGGNTKLNNMPKADETQNIKITKLEVTMTNLQNGLNEIKSEFKEFEDKNDQSHKDIIERIDKFINSADDKYAPKYLVWFLFTTIAGYVIIEGLKWVANARTLTPLTTTLIGNILKLL